MAKKRGGQSNLILGKIGEILALKFLRKSGYRILATNYRAPKGEIDIIGQDKNFLVFFEVKTRIGTSLGFPEEAVTPRKIKSIITTANTFLSKKGNKKDRYRIDVVSIILNPDKTVLDIRHYQNITGE